VTSHRLWEVDVARTVAIAMMVTYHTVYDIDFLAPSVGVNPFEAPWKPLQVATGSSFLAIAGVSFWISGARARERGAHGVALWRKHARRGAEVIGWGLVISLVTLVALGTDDYIRFGILHCIGASIVLGPLFVRLGVWNAALGAAVIAAGLALDGARSDVPGALILGFRPDGGRGVDYYPLLPWFGLFLIGIAIGALLYPRGRRGTWGGSLPAEPPLRFASVPGRHSLAIYLIHQPVLIAVVAAILALTGTSIDWG
jgi:uncharacterized membrane protein